MKAPPSSYNRLQKLVFTMRQHGNEVEDINLETLARFNPWTSADELLVEFRLQQNGQRRLPEEVAANSTKPVPVAEVEE